MDKITRSEIITEYLSITVFFYMSYTMGVTRTAYTFGACLHKMLLSGSW